MWERACALPYLEMHRLICLDATNATTRALIFAIAAAHLSRQHIVLSTLQPHNIRHETHAMLLSMYVVLANC